MINLTDLHYSRPSYLFDPVQVPSPGYVNEVNSCKLDEEDTVKLKAKQSSEVLVRKNDPRSEGLRRTVSGGSSWGPRAPRGPRQGPRPRGDAGGGLCAEKPGGAVNGIGPAAGEPGPPLDGAGSWASPENCVRPAQPFLQGGDARETDCAPPASPETRVLGNGDPRAPSKAGCPAGEGPDLGLQIPAPDYPPCGAPAGDAVDGGEGERLSQRPREGEPPGGARPCEGEPGLGARSPGEGGWDSPTRALAAETLSCCWNEEEPAPPGPVAHPGDGAGDGSGEPEDAAVAEALAALEAATAGEEEEEAA